MSNSTCRPIGHCYIASSSQLLVVQSVTTNNLIAGRAQSLKKAWSLVLKGVVWAGVK